MVTWNLINSSFRHPTMEKQNRTIAELSLDGLSWRFYRFTRRWRSWERGTGAEWKLEAFKTISQRQQQPAALGLSFSRPGWLQCIDLAENSIRSVFQYTSERARRPARRGESPGPCFTTLKHSASTAIMSRIVRHSESLRCCSARHAFTRFVFHFAWNFGEIRFKLSAIPGRQLIWSIENEIERSVLQPSLGAFGMVLFFTNLIHRTGIFYARICKFNLPYTCDGKLMKFYIIIKINY